MDMQNDVDNVFLRKSQLKVDQSSEQLFLIKLGNLMPFFIPVLTYIIIRQALLTSLSKSSTGMIFTSHRRTCTILDNESS